MFDNLFNYVCGDKYNTMVIEKQNDGKLYGIPCDDAISGNYPVYDKKVCLSNLSIEEFDFWTDDEKAYGILVKKCDNKYYIKASEYTWDGYQ